jgi:Rho GTPase-activating protein RGD1
MSMQNLAIVFGPTLFGQHTAVNPQGGVIADTTFQNQVSIDC